MKAGFLFIITLIGANFSEASLTVENVLLEHREDLKLFLDWTHKFGEVFEEQRQKYVDEVNKQQKKYTVTMVELFGTPVSKYISSAARLRNVLVKGDNDYVISDSLAYNMRLLILFMVNMPYVLDDLTRESRKWTRQTRMLRHSCTVMDERSLEWFKDHGFEEASLNDIPIPLLKKELHIFYGNGRPLDSLLMIFGTIYADITNGDIGSKLALLFTFGNNPQAILSLEKYLKRERSRVQQETTDKIIKYLRKLGDKAGTLSRLFVNGIDGGLHSFIMPILNSAIFLEEEGDRYTNVLVNICSSIEEDLRILKDALNIIPMTDRIIFYRQFGFLYRAKEPNVQKLLTKIDALTGDNGTITKLVQLVNKAHENGEISKAKVPHDYLSFEDLLSLHGMIAMGITYKSI